MTDLMLYVLYVFIAAVCAVILLFMTEIFLICGRKRAVPSFFTGLFAHRGLFSNETPEAPENSMAAFRRAVDNGFGIELDVHISADGELFVMHDDSLRRMCGVDGKITSMTASEIKRHRILGGAETIPHFSDVLALVCGRVPLIVELKCAPGVDVSPLCRAVYDMLSSYNGEYCVESFNPYVVSWFRRNAPEVFRGQLAEAFFTRGGSSQRKKNGFMLLTLENLWLNVLGRPDFVAYNCLHINTPSYRLWRHMLHMPAALWTVRSEDMIRTLTGGAAAPAECDAVIFEGFVPER